MKTQTSVRACGHPRRRVPCRRQSYCSGSAAGLRHGRASDRAPAPPSVPAALRRRSTPVTARRPGYRTPDTSDWRCCNVTRVCVCTICRYQLTVDTARLVCGMVNVTVRCPSVCPSACPFLRRNRMSTCRSTPALTYFNPNCDLDRLTPGSNSDQ